MRGIVLICFYCLSLLTTAFPQEEWKLSKDENGIKIYTSSGSDSKFKKVKVEAVFNGTLQKLMSVLMDVDHNKRWVYHTRQSKLLQRIGSNELLYYAETSLPWPLSNRDMAIRMHFDLDSANHRLTITAMGQPDATPLKKGIVRIRDFRARWEVRSDAANQITIRYFLSLNPGGSISPGLSNMFVIKGPYETFKNLSGMLQQ